MNGHGTYGVPGHQGFGPGHTGNLSRFVGVVERFRKIVQDSSTFGGLSKEYMGKLDSAFVVVVLKLLIQFSKELHTLSNECNFPEASEYVTTVISPSIASFGESAKSATAGDFNAYDLKLDDLYHQINHITYLLFKLEDSPTKEKLMKNSAAKPSPIRSPRHLRRIAKQNSPEKLRLNFEDQGFDEVEEPGEEKSARPSPGSLEEVAAGVVLLDRQFLSVMDSTVPEGEESETSQRNSRHSRSHSDSNFHLRSPRSHSPGPSPLPSSGASAPFLPTFPPENEPASPVHTLHARSDITPMITPPKVIPPPPDHEYKEAPQTERKKVGKLISPRKFTKRSKSTSNHPNINTMPELQQSKKAKEEEKEKKTRSPTVPSNELKSPHHAASPRLLHHEEKKRPQLMRSYSIGGSKKNVQKEEKESKEKNEESSLRKRINDKVGNAPRHKSYTASRRIGFLSKKPKKGSTQETTLVNITVIDVCCQFLRDYVKAEGLFRVSGETLNVQNIYDSFFTENEIVLPPNTSPHSVSSALKRWLRNMLPPVISPDFFDEAYQAFETTSVTSMASILTKIDPPQYYILEKLLSLLVEVEQNSSINKMDFKNLGIIFGPSLIPLEIGDDNPIAVAQNQMRTSKIVQFLLQHHQELFKEKPTVFHKNI